MSDIPPIKGAVNRIGMPPPPEQAAEKGASRSAEQQPNAEVDAVEISEMGQLLSTLDIGGDIRIDKVMQIRESIANGTYDIESKLEHTVDRLLNDLRSRE
jgi:anti-sigma28 factor (negative regulator of flagellin synthesis)